MFVGSNSRISLFDGRWVWMSFCLDIALLHFPTFSPPTSGDYRLIPDLEIETRLQVEISKITRCLTNPCPRYFHHQVRSFHSNHHPPLIRHYPCLRSPALEPTGNCWRSDTHVSATLRRQSACPWQQVWRSTDCSTPSQFKPISSPGAFSSASFIQITAPLPHVQSHLRFHLLVGLQPELPGLFWFLSATALTPNGVFKHQMSREKFI